MAVRDIEGVLAKLGELQKSERPEDAIEPLRKALHDKVNLVVAKAAKVAASMQLAVLVPDLCAALERFIGQPSKADPKCWAKEALAKALKQLGHDHSTIFRKGVAYVQYEPVWNGESDTAETFRATCVLALTQCIDLDRQGKLWAVMPLLTEPSPSVRKDGASAIEALAGVEAALMLRIKARHGDKDVTVLSHVFECLLSVEGATAVPFVEEFFRHSNPEVRTEAAFALGASRLESAVSTLTNLLNDKFQRLDQETIFQALAISRHARAFKVLFDAIRTGGPASAISAIQALEMYKNSPDTRDRAREAVAYRSESEIRRQFEHSFRVK